MIFEVGVLGVGLLAGLAATWFIDRFRGPINDILAFGSETDKRAARVGAVLEPQELLAQVAADPEHANGSALNRGSACR